MKRKLLDSIKGVGRGERGAALITALLFLILLTALGMASIVTSTTEIQVARNYRLNVLALDYANAGVDTGLALLNEDIIGSGTNTMGITDPDEVWFVSSTSALPTLTNVFFNVSVTYRKEDSIHMRDLKTTGVDNDEVVGYSVDCGYNKSPIDTIGGSYPVYRVRSRGVVQANGRDMASATVITEVTRNIIDVKGAPAGMTSDACNDLNGTISINGMGKYGVWVNVTGTEPPCGAPTGSVDVFHDDTTVSPFKEATGGDVVDTDTVLGMPFDEVVGMATNLYPPMLGANLTITGEEWGRFGGPYPDDPVIIYIDNSNNNLLKLNNVKGFGILLVDGPIEIGGSTEWWGIIYVKGVLTFNGGGATGVNIHGNVIATGISDDCTNASTPCGNVMGGHTNITDDEAAENNLGAAFNSKTVNWQREYNYDTTYE